MQPFETISELRAFPTEWKEHGIVLPFSIGTVDTINPYSLTRSGLPLHLLLYTISGEGRLSYNGQDYKLSEGDVIFIDCKQLHNYSAISQKWRFCFVHLYSGAVADTYFNEITSSGKNVLFHNPSFYKECFLKLKEYSENVKITTHIKASMNLIDAILNLALCNVKSIPEGIKGVVDYINENFTEEIRIEDLCGVSNLSKYYLIRSFAKYYNSTPYEYILLCRTNKAKEMLLDGNKNIEEISTECGFSSVVSFNRTFKEKVGFSPTKFRKELSVL